MSQGARSGYRERERERGQRQLELVARLQQIAERTESREAPVRPAGISAREWWHQVTRERSASVAEVHRIKREIQRIHADRMRDLRLARPSRAEMSQFYADIEKRYGGGRQSDLLRRWYDEHLAGAERMDPGTRRLMLDDLVDWGLHPRFSWRRIGRGAVQAGRQAFGQALLLFAMACGASVRVWTSPMAAGVVFRLLIRVPAYALVLLLASRLRVTWVGAAAIVVFLANWCYSEWRHWQQWSASS